MISKPVLLTVAQQEHVEALADTGLCIGPLARGPAGLRFPPKV